LRRAPRFDVPYRVHRDRLPNGLRVCIVETPHLHSAVVALYVRAGARYETPETNGLSHFVEHMVFRGSAHYPSSYALNRAIEERGGTLYAETARDYSLYQIGVHPREVPAALHIMGDLFGAPTFEDIERERPIILEEILEDLDDRGRNVNAHDLSRAAVWGDHPLGLTIIGPARNVRRFSTEDVRRHFDRFYGARNMVLCVAGRVEPRGLRAAIGEAFSGVRAGRRALPVPAPARPPRGPRVKFVHDDTAQVQFQMLFHGVPEEDPDYPAMATLLRLTDDGMSTPLHYRIADQRGLAYHVGAGLEALHDATLVELDAACSPAKLPDLVDEVLAILDEFRRRPVAPAELDKAKRRYVGDLEASVDDLEGLAGWFGGNELFFQSQTHLERARRMMRVTAEDVRRVARRVLRRDRLTAVGVGAVGPAIARRVRARIAGF
jgi:predicted Zn-dependent peptidase